MLEFWVTSAIYVEYESLVPSSRGSSNDISLHVLSFGKPTISVSMHYITDGLLLQGFSSINWKNSSDVMSMSLACVSWLAKSGTQGISVYPYSVGSQAGTVASWPNSDAIVECEVAVDVKEVKSLTLERSGISRVELSTKLDLGESSVGEAVLVMGWSTQVDLVSFLFKSLLALVLGDDLDADVAFFFHRET